MTEVFPEDQDCSSDEKRNYLNRRRYWTCEVSGEGLQRSVPRQCASRTGCDCPNRRKKERHNGRN